MQTLTKTPDTIDPKLEPALAMVDRALERMRQQSVGIKHCEPVSFSCGDYCEGCDICTDADNDGGRFDWETSRGVS